MCWNKAEMRGDSENSQTPYSYGAPVISLNFFQKFTPSGAPCQ